MDGSEFQEIWRYIGELESKINDTEALESRISDLESRVADLENEKETMQNTLDCLAGDVKYMQRPKEEF